MEQRIIGIISENLGVPKKDITLESSFRKDLGAETLAVADLLAKIQEELNIDLEEVEAEKIKTVGQLVNFITSLDSEFV